MAHFLSYLVPLEKMIIGLDDFLSICDKNESDRNWIFNKFRGIEYIWYCDQLSCRINVGILVLAYLFGTPEMIECIRDTIEKKYSIQQEKLFLFSSEPLWMSKSLHDAMSRAMVIDLKKNDL